MALYILALLAVAPLIPRGALPADAGEFQLVARELGIAHPPGYPTYTVTAHVFGRIVNGVLPWPASETWPFSVNLFSTALALATVFVTAAAGRRFSGSWMVGLLAAAVLASSPTFVSLALVANVRTMTALLAAIVLLMTLAVLEDDSRSESRSRDQRSIHNERSPLKAGLVPLGIAFGLAAGHHQTLAFLALPVGLALLLGGALRGRHLINVAGAGAAALVTWWAPYAYLPLRDAAGAPLAPGDLTNPAALWRFATGAAFRSDLLGLSELQRLIDRTAVVWNVFSIQFGLLGIVLAAVGLSWLLADSRRRPAGLLLGGTALVITALAVFYRAPQTVEYLMPAYVAVALLCGASLWPLFAAIRWYERRGERRSFGDQKPLGESRLRLLAGIPIILVVSRALMSGLPGTALAAVPEIEETVRHVQEIFSCAERSALNGGSDAGSASGALKHPTVFASWHWATPLWLATESGLERGTARTGHIRYVAPDWTTGDPIGVTWNKLLEQAGQDGAVIVTNRTNEIMQSGRSLWPLDGTPFWSDRPLGTCLQRSTIAPGHPAEPADEPSASTDTSTASLSQVGARPPGGGAVTFDTAQTRVSAKLRSAEVRIGFRVGEPLVQPLAVSLQLVNPSDGAVWAQADRTYDALRWNDPDGLVIRSDLVPFVGQVPSVFDARVSTYEHGESGPVPVPWSSGEPTMTIGRVETTGWPSRESTPGAIPFGYAMILDESEVKRSGDQIIVDIHWIAERAFESDFTVSVHAEGDGWKRQHDATPALGAIPTLKWLPGWRIRDRHRIDLPPDTAAETPLTISVSVYDAFSLEPLPVTHADLVSAGQGQRATIHQGALP